MDPIVALDIHEVAATILAIEVDSFSGKELSVQNPDDSASRGTA